MPSWLKVLAGAAAAVAIAVTAWLVLSGEAIVGDAHRRNFHDLDVAAHGLESWPDALRILARAQFVAGNIRPATGRQQDDGWTYRVMVTSPTLGPYQILYAVRDSEAACNLLRATVQEHERMRLPFIASNRSGEGPQLKIVDSIPLRDLYRADHAATAPLPSNGITIDRISADGGPQGNPMVWPTNAFLCYASVVSIERLLAVRSSRSPIVNYLIVDGDRRVVRQLGASPIPIDSIDQLAPQDSALNLALATAIPASRTTIQASKPTRLAEALDPVPLTIARRAYVAYVRPFHLPPGVPGCEPTDGVVKGPAPPSTCFLVGLVPQEEMRRSALSIAPLPGTIFLLAFILLLALVPAIQVLLIGPGEAVPKLTAIFAIAGLVLAAGVATITVTFAGDVIREREAARRQGQLIAERMAALVGADITAALRATVRLEAANHTHLIGSSGDADTIEPRPYDARGDMRQTTAFGDRLFGTLTFIDATGRNLACGAATLRFNIAAGSRTDVGGRDYFARLRERKFDGPVPARPELRYTIDQIRSQTDGINRTTLALGPLPTAAGRSASCQPFLLLATTILPDLVSPVLPSPFGFMVVDGRAAGITLPVLFHSEEQRAGVETLTTALDNNAIAALREWWSTDATAMDRPAGTFVARYDGARRGFAAASIPGTPWMLLIQHPLDKIDRIAARTALFAVANWISWCAGAPLLYWLMRRLYLLSRGRPYNLGRDLARMWPRERSGRPYRRLAVQLACLAGIAIPLVLLFGSILPSLAVLIAAAAATGTLVLLFVASGREADTVGALRPETERDYRRMLGVAALSVAVVPALALWGDARTLVVAQHDAQVLAEMTKPSGAIARWQTGIEQLGASVGLSVNAFRSCAERSACLAGIDARPVTNDAIVADEVPGLSGTLARWIGRPPPTHRTCTRDAGALRTLCARDTAGWRQGGISAHAAPLPSLARGGWLDFVMVALIGAVMGIGLWQLFGRLLVAMAGFGIPLEAITRPNLYVGDRDCAPPLTIATPLPDRALIVGAPLVLREHFIATHGTGRSSPTAYTQVDLAAPGTLQLGPGDNRIVAFGLQLVLNDGDRRREALQRLEACDRHIRKVAGRQLVIMSALSPLERIIDAYERDRDDQNGDQALLKYREQLRWSLLLERYATFTFRAVDNYNPDGRRSRAKVLLAQVDEQLSLVEPNPRERHRRIRIIETMLAEIRWLPAHVVESAIGVDITGPIARLAARRRKWANIFPLRDLYYQWVIVPLVIEWALRLKPASRQATVDYLRGAIIEHYQQCWSASTLAERVVLDHLAHDRVVNVERASIALTALVRRGLVVFDPTPRLMNNSFRMFVRQAERPERIREWRALQPVGAWARARLPLLIAIPTIGAAIVLEAIWAGVDPAIILPLFLAGLPALATQIGQVVRLAGR